MSVRNYPQESIAGLVEALVRGYFELHEIREPPLTEVKALALDGVARVGVLRSLALAQQAARLKLTLAGAGGEVLEVDLGTAPVTPSC
jgi:hypothetical protein